MYKVVLDSFGADRGIEVIVKGAVDALALSNELVIVITGDSDALNLELAKYDYDKSRVVVEDAKEQITNNEEPSRAVRTKKNSSLVRAWSITKNDESVVGMVSAGSTGAVLAGGICEHERVKGVLRPALCPVLPTMTGGKVCVCDCGANVDCKPEYLAQFAVLASNYMKFVCGVENPRVALLSVGVEDKKGNALTHAAFEILKTLPINFVGNMEARDALTGDYDVLVSDGFMGNILIKSVEGTASMIMKMLKREIMDSFTAKVGAVFMKKAIGNLRESMDYQAVGGAAFLGFNKLVVKAHGSSNAKAITASIAQVVNAQKLGYLDAIKRSASVLSQAKEAEKAE